MSQRLRSLAAGVFIAALLVFPGILLSGLGAFVWQEYGATALAPAGAGLLLAAWIVRRRRRAAVLASPDARGRPHGGITMSAVPIAGGVGLIITIGYIVMFWFGAPGYRPLVLGVAGAGGLLGLVLIRRAHSRPQGNDTSILHLDGDAQTPGPVDHSGRRDDVRFAIEPLRVRVARA
jgi:hypothetical protein